MVSHPVDVHVGQRLKSRRVIVGLSQDELGTAIGVTFQQIQKYERGLNRIGCSRLLEIANVLKTPISFFFEGLNQVSTAPVIMAAEDGDAFITESFDSGDKSMIALIRAFQNIKDEKVRKNIIALVKSLALESGE